MKEIKKHVRFCIKGCNQWKDSKKPRSIIMMFNYDGNRLCTTTGLKVPLDVWDKARHRVTLKGEVKRAHQVNACLDRIEQRVNDIYYGALAEGIQPDNDYILNELKMDKKSRIDDKVGIIRQFIQFIATKKVTLKNLILKLQTND